MQRQRKLPEALFPCSLFFLSCSSDLFTWFMRRLNSSLSVQKLSRVYHFCCTEASEAFKYAPRQVGSNTQHPAVIKVLTNRAIGQVTQVTQVTQRENANFFGGEYVFKMCQANKVWCSFFGTEGGNSGVDDILKQRRPGDGWIKKRK